MSKPPTLPSVSGPDGPVSDDAIVDHFITSYAGGDARTAVDILIRSNRNLMTELRDLRGAEPEPVQRDLDLHALDGDGVADIEAAADMVVAACDGDMLAALKATLVANAYLEREIDHIIDLVSPGFARGHVRPAG
jgi:hypothetical protein